MLPVATPSPLHHNHLHRRHHQYQQQQRRSPTPTARPTVEDYVRLALEKRDVVVTVESTLAGQPTQYSSPKKPIPIGPIVGGVVAGVLIVLLAGGFWWWWVANKPRVVAQREARVVPKTAAGRVLPPISKRDSSRSSASTFKPPLGSSPLSEKQSYPLGPVSSPSSRSRPLSNNNKPPVQPRSVSAESQLHLLPTLSSDASSSSSHDGDRNTSPPPAVGSTRLSVPVNKYVPAKPSPLAAGAATSSAAPKWGEIPFQSHITPPAPSAPAPTSTFSSPLPPPVTNSFSLAAPLANANNNRTSQSSIQSAQSEYSQRNSPYNQERFSSQTTGAFEYDDPNRTTYYGGDEEEKRRSGSIGGQRGEGRQSYGYLVSTAPSSTAPPPSTQNGNGPARTSQLYSQQQPLPQPNRYSQPPPPQQQQQHQQAWDQGGYGPRYDYESGYPSEELDGYYGSATGGGEGGRS